MAAVTVEPASRSDLRSATRVLADAFTDDPVWTAIGPRWSRRHRNVSNHLAFAGILAGSSRGGARIRVAREGSDVVGVSIAFEPGAWPLPQGSVAWELGWLLVAGPLPARRGLSGDALMRSHHPTHPHMYLWFLAVHPSRHHRGIGRALLAELHADSESLGVPTYLETGTLENVPYYEGGGYEVVGDLEMPTGVPMWLMERPVGEG